jgi:hypothetical protein
MNRHQRRAEKRTHKLTPQTTVLWVAALRGYLSRFTPGNFAVVDNADYAEHFNEDRASITAMNFKNATGLSAAVRPYYG